MKNKSSILWGVTLICIGVLVVLDRLKIFSLWAHILPAVLLGASLLLHLWFFISRRKNTAVLIPAGILLVYGIYFLLVSLHVGAGWWPLLVLGPAVGLLARYVASHGKKGSLQPVFILTLISGVCLLAVQTEISLWVLMGAALVICGIVLVLSALLREKSETAGDKETYKEAEFTEVPKDE